MPFMEQRVGAQNPMNLMNTVMDSDMWRSNMKRMTDGAVMYIPAMMDGSCGTMPMHHRMSPMRMMLRESRIMAQNLVMCLPEMIRSVWVTDMSGRGMIMSMGSMDVMEAGLQTMLGMMEMVCLMIVVPAFMMLPGVMVIPVGMMCALMIMMMCWPMNGDRITRCPSSSLHSEETMNERWIYINGSMTSSRQLMNHLRRLSMIFCRPITGVHNRTYGPILDLMSPMLMSMFPMTTSTSMTLHAEMREAMMSPNCEKIIILAHGTGAAILSQVLDRMHCDMPEEMMRKMEIFTFGSAARHLSNPCMSSDRPVTMGMGLGIKSPSGIMDMMLRNEESERVIPWIEHYAMSTDIAAQTGILHHTLNELNNRFCGRTFMMSRPGFTFSQYMDQLFPTSSSPSMTVNKRSSFQRTMLDQVVEVDVVTAEKREFTAQGMMGGMGRNMNTKRCAHPMSSAQCILCTPSRCAHAAGSNLCGMCTRCSHGMMVAVCSSCIDDKPTPEPKHSKDAKTVNGDKPGKMTNAEMKEKKERPVSMTGAMMMGMGDSVAMARASAKMAEGKTMKELSRLWRYQSGMRPGMGEEIVNGLGLNGIRNGVGLNMPKV